MIAVGREQVGRGWTGPYEVHLPGMVPSDRGSVATAVSTPAVTDKLLHGPFSGKKIQKKAPRKVHKAEREKLKRDQLNDHFVELGDMLGEADQDELLDMEAPNTWKVPSVKQTKLQEQKLPTA
ncbi:hypothetical protein EJB05_22103 [Eragrostis curvula]|uniref:BHLH domain-containing protein n=1 Tax=Eragrostis curvula TaxID=38414 RepID=A0A5J9V3K5_9POAL|nr:hypothetical protein EJB05_22103 [Eragrostis curvula]